MPKKKVRAKKMPKRYAFVQTWGSYTNQTLVVIGAKTKQDFLVAFEKVGTEPSVMKTVREKFELPASFETDNGFFYTLEPSGASILHLAHAEDEWCNLEVLIHEIYHAVDFILGKSKGMADEHEARAYQMEFLFRAIRRTIQGVDKTEIVRF